MPASLTSRHCEALLALPSGHAHSALRAGLMAMNVVPQPLSPGVPQLLAQLRALDRDTRRVAFVDISDHRPSLIELDHALPRGPARSRIFLTRLRGGHTSEADRRWVHKLGFGGLWAEFALDPSTTLGIDDNRRAAPDGDDGEPGLHHALARVAAALETKTPTAAELKRHAASPQEQHEQPARELIRRATGSSAEAVAAALAKRLRVRDRQYHDRHHAWIVLHRLMQSGAFDHVAAARPFIDGHFFYRFAPVLDEALASNERRAADAVPGSGSLLPTW